MKTKRQNQTRSSSDTGKRQRTGRKIHGLALRRILVPMDFSGKSRQALEFAVPLAKQYGGKISLIHVVEPAYSASPYPVTITYPGAMEPALGFAAPNLEEPGKKLAALAAEMVPPELLGKILVRVGRAYLEIVQMADKLKTDLIALSTHGHTGLKHALLGSTAERVVRHAPCAVLTVRRH